MILLSHSRYHPTSTNHPIITLHQSSPIFSMCKEYNSVWGDNVGEVVLLYKSCTLSTLKRWVMADGVCDDWLICGCRVISYHPSFQCAKSITPPHPQIFQSSHIPSVITHFFDVQRV